MARKHKCEEDDSARWLGTYGDAVTLLMAFFVMLYSMSEVDAAKFKSFVQGLTVFGNESSAASLLPAGSGLQEGDAIVDDRGQLQAPDTSLPPPPPAPAPEPVTAEPEDGQAVVARTGAAAEPSDERDAAGRAGTAEQPGDRRGQLVRVRKRVIDALAGAGVPSVATYRFDQRGLVISIAADDVLFSTGSTSISGKGADVVRAVAKALRPFGNQIVVEGHTDSVPLDRGGYTNWNLSTDRAVAVVSTLYRDHGIDQSRLAASGYGEHRPVASNSTAAGRAKNRRVDILIVAEGKNDG